MVANLINTSDERQQTIRERSVIIPEESVGTIDPDKLSSTGGPGYKRVFADSFGPFNPHKYFSSPYKILFLLKESYIGTLEEEKDYKFGHNKAAEYRCVEYGDLPPTYQGVAQTCYALLNNNRQFDGSASSIITAMECMHDNSCIINANKFPCIGGTESNDNYVYKWARNNLALISDEIKLYDSSIIIGGHTLAHFLEYNPARGKWKLFGEEVDILYPDDIFRNFHKQMGDNHTYYNSKHLYINAYHPSMPGYDNYIDLICHIRDWWESEIHKHV